MTAFNGCNRHLDDLPTDFLVKCYETIKALDEEIDGLQRRKKSLFETVRSQYDRHQAEALKTAMRLLRMDKRQRAERIDFSATASRYVDAIDSEIEAREAAGLL